MTRRVEFKVDGVHTYHYEGVDDAKYVLIICHGGGGWGGMYDDWAYPYTEKYKADVWCFDQPGFGQTGERSMFDAEQAYEALKTVIGEVRDNTDLPIFVLGSSFGGYLSTAALTIDEVQGTISQGTYLVADGPVIQQMRMLFSSPPMQAFLATPFGQACMINLDHMIKWEENYGDAEKGREIQADPNHLSLLSLSGQASMALFDLPFPLSENKKPHLMMVAEHDPLIGDIQNVHNNFNWIGGPTELKIKEGSDRHQLMMFENDWFSPNLDAFCLENI